MEAAAKNNPASSGQALPVMTYDDQLTLHTDGQEMRVVHLRMDTLAGTASFLYASQRGSDRRRFCIPRIPRLHTYRYGSR